MLVCRERHCQVGPRRYIWIARSRSEILFRRLALFGPDGPRLNVPVKLPDSDDEDDDEEDKVTQEASRGDMEEEQRVAAPTVKPKFLGRLKGVFMGRPKPVKILTPGAGVGESSLASEQERSDLSSYFISHLNEAWIFRSFVSFAFTRKNKCDSPPRMTEGEGTLKIGPVPVGWMWISADLFETLQ